MLSARIDICGENNHASLAVSEILLAIGDSDSKKERNQSINQRWAFSQSLSCQLVWIYLVRIIMLA